MATDIAQRDIDLAGFRLLNLGTPQSAAEATRVDPNTVPLAASGVGTPGASLLAAPADHVHPQVGPSAILQFEGEGPEIGVGPVETVIYQRLVDFSEMSGESFDAVFTAFVEVDAGDTGTFNVRLGGTAFHADGDVIATITTTSPATVPEIATGPAVARPGQPTLVKITAAAVNPTARATIREFRIALAD